MHPLVRNAARHLLRRPSTVIAARLPSRSALTIMRKARRIQLSTEQLYLIAKAVAQKRPCNLLVFGLGNDSTFWRALNRHGTTVFLEDNEDWYRKITGESPDLDAYLVEYTTRRKDWRQLIEQPENLDLALPEHITHTAWDVIVVDGPMGYCDDSPGRMISIYQAPQLGGPACDVFIHDCNREVEARCCERFLQSGTMVIEIDAPPGSLRYYRMNG